MQLSISNIAWSKEEDESIYALLKENGIGFVDIAPSRIWEKPSEVTSEDVGDFLQSLSQYNLKVTGMQSLLYQQPDLQIFQSMEAREKTQRVLMHMIDLASWLGVRALVFGSPKNRNMGQETKEKWQIAKVFFKELGDYAEKRNTCFCLEPNPTIYDSDFLTGTVEALEFVKEVASKGLKINLDTGTMIENGEQIFDLLATDIPHIGHVHLSMPYLKILSINDVHVKTIKLLKENNYSGALAIEMARSDGFETVKSTLESMKKVLG